MDLHELTLVPLLLNMLLLLAIVAVAFLIWLAISVPSALLYIAVAEPLRNLAEFLRNLLRQCQTLARELWQRGCDECKKVAAIINVRLIYKFQDDRAYRAIKELHDVIGMESNKIRTAAEQLQTGIDALKDTTERLGTSGTDIAIDIQQRAVPDASSGTERRRMAMVVMAISVPILVVLVGINTVMLNEFFASLVEMRLRWLGGLHLSVVLALFFSILEIALGMMIYYTGLHSNDDGLMCAVKQTFLVFLVAALAIIEMYLYYRLSLRMAPGIEVMGEGDFLAPWVHQTWMSPFGLVIPCVLAFVGHAFFKAINDFVEGGHQKASQKIARQHRDFLVKIIQSGGALQVRVDGIRQQLRQFLASTVDGDNQTSSLAQINSRLDEVHRATNAMLAVRREPYSGSLDVKQEMYFALCSLMLLALPVIALVFWWTQRALLAQYFLEVPYAEAWMAAIAVTEIVAVLIASHRLEQTITIVHDHPDGGVLESFPTKWLGVTAIATIVAVIMVGAYAASEGRREESAWFAVLLSTMCVGALFFIGNKLPLLAATFMAWIFAAFYAVLAAAAFVVALVLLLLYCVSVVSKTVLYILAFPMLKWKWKARVAESGQQRDE